MKKTKVLGTLAVLTLLVSWLVVPQGGWARSPGVPLSPLPPMLPELGPFINIWTGDPIDNTEPAVAYGIHHDEYLVTWQNEHLGWTEVYGRRVGGDESPKVHKAIASTQNHWNQGPAMAYTPMQDIYQVAYTYNSPADTTFDVKGKFVGWDLNYLFPEQNIRVEQGSQWGPAVAYNSQWDEFLIVYENWWAGGLRDIAAQRIKASTGAFASWRNIATGAGEWRHTPKVAYNEARNEYLITYTYSSNATQGNGDIYGIVASANLGTLSGEFLIKGGGQDQEYSAVAAGPDEYLVVWSDGDPATADYDIYGRRVSGEGQPLGPAGGFLISSTSAAWRESPDVAFGGRCGYLVVWSHAEGISAGWPPTLQDVYGARVPVGQDTTAGGQFAIDDGADLQSEPAVACAPWGRCLVVEQDNWPAASGNGYQIRGRMASLVCPHVTFLPLVLRDR